MSRVKNVVICLLIVMLMVAAYVYLSAKEEAELYRTALFNDFYGCIMDVSWTMTNITQILDVEKKEDELFLLALKNELNHLARVNSRIRVVEARLDPQKMGFAKEYSTQKLMSTIHNINQMVRAAIVEQTVPADMESIRGAVRIIAQAAGELVFDNSTGDLLPEDIDTFLAIADRELANIQSEQEGM